MHSVKQIAFAYALRYCNKQTHQLSLINYINQHLSTAAHQPHYIHRLVSIDFRLNFNKSLGTLRCFGLPCLTDELHLSIFLQKWKSSMQELNYFPFYLSVIYFRFYSLNSIQYDEGFATTGASSLPNPCIPPFIDSLTLVFHLLWLYCS